MARLIVLLACALLLAPASAALAQSSPFGPLPPPNPTAPPVPEDVQDAAQEDVGRRTLYIIGAAVLVAIAGVGYAISRDARRQIPEGRREEVSGTRPDPVKAKEHSRAKAKARAKARDARRQRKRNR